MRKILATSTQAFAAAVVVDILTLDSFLTYAVGQDDNPTMMRTAALLLLVLSTTANAFVVSPSAKHVSLFSTIRALSDEVSMDPFDSYKKGDVTSVITKDLAMGSGDPVQDGNTIKIAFKGFVLESGKLFEEGDLIFKAGPEGRGMKAFKDGISGMRVGGKRLIRVPYKDAYGDVGSSSGKVPPMADLEFEVEALDIKSNPIEAFMMQYELGANGRTYGLVACVAVLALSPLLPH
jgi:FKBP-type peptidyl-prolyl cis-trans isomerase